MPRSFEVKYFSGSERGEVAMEYTLMHKNIPVLDLDIDEETGNIAKILDVFDKRRKAIAAAVALRCKRIEALG